MRCHLAATFSTMRRVRLISRTLSRHDMNACDVDWFRHRYISFVIFAVLRCSASSASLVAAAASTAFNRAARFVSPSAAAANRADASSLAASAWEHRASRDCTRAARSSARRLDSAASALVSPSF